MTHSHMALKHLNLKMGMYSGGQGKTRWCIVVHAWTTMQIHNQRCKCEHWREHTRLESASLKTALALRSPEGQDAKRPSFCNNSPSIFFDQAGPSLRRTLAYFRPWLNSGRINSPSLHACLYDAGSSLSSSLPRWLIPRLSATHVHPSLCGTIALTACYITLLLLY